MRLKPTLKKTVISLAGSLLLAVILFILSFFGYDIGIFTLVVIFIVGAALVYMIWSLVQPEFDEEDEYEEYEEGEDEEEYEYEGGKEEDESEDGEDPEMEYQDDYSV